jgi:hypothetical protein
MGLHSGNGGLPALPGYIRQRWEWLTVADTIAITVWQQLQP